MRECPAHLYLASTVRGKFHLAANYLSHTPHKSRYFLDSQSYPQWDQLRILLHFHRLRIRRVWPVESFPAD